MTILKPCVTLLALTLVACGDDPGRDHDRAPTVVGGVVQPMRFVDSMEGVGTAYAREATTLTSTVTERVVSIGYRDGEVVRRGDVIAVLSSGEERADLASVEARANETGQQLKRLRELQQRGFATNARIDEQVALRNQARADANAIREQISDRVVRAPFAGVVGLRRISPGAVVTAGTEIATVSDISTIKLDFTLPETFLAAVAADQPIEAKSASYPGEVFRGRIEGIDPALDPVTRSVTVRAVLPNADRRLRPGMLLTVAIVTNPREALAVPALALVAQRDQQYVFRLNAKNIASRVPIETGMRMDGMVEVVKGLGRGDRIVADGVVKVRDDVEVKPVFPARPSSGGGSAKNARQQ